MIAILHRMIATFLLALSVAVPAPQGQAIAMTTYQMVFLKKGPNHDAVAKGPDAQKIQQQHLANLIALNQKRVNLLFGPLLDENELQGILVLDVPDAAAAAKAMEDDPYVKSGAMTVTVHPWFGPKDFFNLPAEGQQAESSSTASRP